MKAMLLAAGLGTRLRPVTEALAKPAVSFLNIPLLYYPIALLEAAGMSELVINAHYKPEQVRRLSEEIPGFDGPVHLSLELERPLGSGGGVSQARRWLEQTDDFLVANGDEVIIPSDASVMPAFVRHHKQTNAFATILVMRHPGVGTQFGGVWTDSSGKVHGFGKKPPEGATEDTTEDLTGFHYIGVLILSSRVFKYLPLNEESNLLYDALMSAIRDGERVQIFEDSCTWFETGNIKDFTEATGQCLELLYHGYPGTFLRDMASRFWPAFSARPEFERGARSDVQIQNHGVNVRLLMGNDVRAEGPLAVEGFAVIGDGARIGRGCHLQNCVILPGARVADGAKLHHTVIAPA